MKFLSTASEIERTLGQLMVRCEHLSLAVAWASRNTRCCDLLLEYRVVWAKQQLSLRRLSGEYGTSQNASPRNRSPLEVEELALAWPDYLDLVKKDPHFHVKERLRLLTKARELFATQVPFSQMPLRDRQLIGGFSAKIDFDWRVFGSMEGFGNFKKAVNSGYQDLSDALDEIPLDGDVTEKHYRAYVSKFRSALAIKDGTGAITRLLALKRPDIFFVLTARTTRNSSRALGSAAR
jgi:hypothetical protein